jgi:hypothetical protein
MLEVIVTGQVWLARRLQFWHNKAKRRQDGI